MLPSHHRCHMPRLAVEEEDSEDKKKRLEQEKKDREELVKIMEDMDLTWEEKRGGSRNLCLRRGLECQNQGRAKKRRN